jgi:hypothetical protein
MSIRAEDAAAEASRFSLRTSLFGGGAPDTAPTHSMHASAGAAAVAYGHIPQSHRTNQTHQQRPVASPFAPAMQTARLAAATTAVPPRAPPTLSLSFNSVIGQRPGGHGNTGNTSSNAHTGTQSANQKSTQATLQAIARIAEEHRLRAAATGRMASAAPTTGLGASSDATRTLPSGYIHGGNQRIDAQAEVMRLTATVDALNGQLASQSERLQRTESSLVRANRAMTSERATSNARLLRMQNEVKDLRSRESTVRESALAQTRREVQKSDVSFGESAKRAEAYDAKLSALEERIRTLSGEKTSLSTRVEELVANLEQSAVRVDAAEAKLTASAADTPGNEEEVARLSQSVEAASAAKKELTERLVETEAKHEAVLLELEEARMGADTARAAVAQSDSALEDVRKQLQTEVEDLLSRNEALQARLDEIVSFPIANDCDALYRSDGVCDEVNLGGASREDLESQLIALDAQIGGALSELDTCSGIEASKCYKRTGRLTKQRHTIQTELNRRPPLHEDAPQTSHTDATVVQTLRAELDASQAGLRVVGAAIGCYSPEDGDDWESRQSTIERWMELLKMGGDEQDTQHGIDSYERDGATGASKSPASKVVFQSPPSKLQSQCAFGAQSQHPIACRLGASMARYGHGKRLPPCRVNPMSSYRLTRAKFDTGAMGAVPTGNGGGIPPDVAALIEAVSKDISDACVRQRRAYLATTGMSDAEIQAELSSYA